MINFLHAVNSKISEYNFPIAHSFPMKMLSLVAQQENHENVVTNPNIA